MVYPSDQGSPFLNPEVEHSFCITYHRRDSNDPHPERTNAASFPHPRTGLAVPGARGAATRDKTAFFPEG